MASEGIRKQEAESRSAKEADEQMERAEQMEHTEQMERDNHMLAVEAWRATVPTVSYTPNGIHGHG